MSTLKLTPLGTATVLLEVGGLRLLTDPVLDPPGQTYRFGWGTGSTKTEAPALSADQLGDVDVVLLSHDQHDDNFDAAGRRVAERAGRVITTVPGARRLGSRAVGLRPWQSVDLTTPDGTRLTITATPARHGPPLIRPFSGAVVGFVLQWPGQVHGAVYVSGDTVWFRGVAQVARRFRVGTALLHLGGVGFPLYGPLRFTMNAREAVRAARALDARTVVPLHYEGWTHFRQPRSEAEAALATLGGEARVLWLPRGEPATLEV